MEKHFPKISFLHHTSDTDARAKSLNMGMKLCFPDAILPFWMMYCNKVYPHHYQQMVQALQKVSFHGYIVKLSERTLIKMVS